MLVLLIGLCNYTTLDKTVVYLIAWGIACAVSFIAIVRIHHAAIAPLETVQKLLSYADNSAVQSQAPDLEKSKLGKELLEAMSRQIYSLASASTAPANTDTIAAQPIAPTTIQPQAVQNSQNRIIDELSAPIIGMNGGNQVTVANKAALDYFGDTAMVGKSIDDVLHLSFQGGNSLEQWLNDATQSSVTATQSWERVRHSTGDEDENIKQFDMIASYSKNSSTGTDTLLAIYDKTTRYGLDDQELSLVALAVHELRTPLTVMRGYVEVFQDELGPTLTPELKDFMHKMQASTQQLTAFVGNILNVARVEENQLVLTLREGNWAEILKNATDDLQLRAQVHGINISLSVAENLPTVGVDKISAHEIINNLVDNAIKYSNGKDSIVITAKINDEGIVETSVQDFGVGIPTSVMGTLFQKYHRSHKSRTQVGGTGLGLYLCKALVGAHGGNIWVRSKENEGSIFSFTLLPYSQLTAEQISGEDGIVRGAHGWIKNHSLYRS